jgi:hypothetical protein
MKDRSLMLQGALRIIAASFLFLARFSLSLAGQETAPAASLVGKFFPAECAKKILIAVEKLDELKKASADLLQIKIGGGFSENIVPDSLANLEREAKELSKLNLNSSISKGFFPNELTFITDSSFQLEDGAVKENVTKLLLNYEYYFSKCLEGYVFVERFSDSYLSIQQRYEIGTGLKLETDSLALFQKGGDADRFEKYRQTLQVAVEFLKKKETMYYAPELLKPMAQALAKIESNLGDPGLKKQIRDIIEIMGSVSAADNPATPLTARDLDLKLMALIVELEEDRGDIIQKWLDDKTLALADLSKVKAFLEEKLSVLSSSKAKEAMVSWRKKNAFLGLGLAFSLFSEIEKAEIKEEIMNDVWETISLPACHRLRWVLRPSFELRPIESVTLKGQFYFKYFLWEPNGKNKRPNMRQDHYIRLDYELPASIAWAKALTFFIAYEFHYDSVPPSIPNATLEELAARYGIGVESINPSADKKHYVLNLGVEVKF